MASGSKVILGLVSGVVLSISAHAAADGVFGAGERSAVIRTLADKVKANYVLPDRAERIAAALLKKDAGGGYSDAVSAQALSAALSRDLREYGNDKHFRAIHDERFRERPATDTVPSHADMEDVREQMSKLGYGIETIQRLPGNVGYIELRGFGAPEFVAPAYSAAMTLLAGTDALIIDLRRNGGGRAASVALFMSMFFPHGDQRHLNDIHDRPSGTTQQYWTLPSVGPRYAKPVYVLTSARTFSGGEECAYDFQTQKRATLVGETTGGGANPVSPFSIGRGIVVTIPTGRSINPVTKTSWEQVGVKPDIETPAAKAQQAAHVAILRSLLASQQDPGLRASLQRALAMAEKGETETPVYTMRQ